MTKQTSDITARLERLEQENRRLKRIGGGLAAVVAAIGLMSASSAFCKTVWAERLVLRDSSGKDRLLMDAYGGAPTVTMSDAKGKPVARFSWQEGVAMEMLDAQGRTSSRVHVDPAGKVERECKGEGDLIGMAR